MMTSLPPRLRRLVLALLLAAGAAPAAAQPIEAGSQDALDLPGTRQYGTPAGRDSAVPPQGRRQFSDRPGIGTASPDLPATLPQRQGGFQVPYGAYGGNGYGENGYGGPDDGDRRSGYAGRDGYGSAGGYDDGSGDTRGGTYGDGEFRAGESALVAPFGGGPGNQTPIPLGAGSLYSGSAVNGTAVGPQFSSQLPAYQGRPRR